MFLTRLLPLVSSLTPHHIGSMIYPSFPMSNAVPWNVIVKEGVSKVFHSPVTSSKASQAPTRTPRVHSVDIHLELGIDQIHPPLVPLRPHPSPSPPPTPNLPLSSPLQSAPSSL